MNLFDKDPQDSEIIQEQEQPQSQEPSLEEQLAAMKDQWLRAMAETENLRRRSQKEREDALKYASTAFAKDMISIGDNLRRALETCPSHDELSESVKGLISGIEMTEKELETTFERHGIKKMIPLEDKFDPNLHQAMFEIPNSGKANGTVIQVLQAGYIMHDRLLRPAMVGVAKGDNSSSDASNELNTAL